MPSRLVEFHVVAVKIALDNHDVELGAEGYERSAGKATTGRRGGARADVPPNASGEQARELADRGRGARRAEA